MNTARLSLTSSTTPNCQAVVIHADSKQDAQETIRTVRAWARANGRWHKIVYFRRTTSYWSNLVWYYEARIVFRAAA